MEYLNNFKNSLARELNQNNALQRNLLISILSSRRLLADHLDILEEALEDCVKHDVNSSEKLTFMKTAGVVATSYIAFAYFQNNYAIPCITSTVPLLYMRKQINIQQRKSAENILKNLIDAFNEFESGVNKTISFINDAQVMESYARILNRYDRRNQIPFHLVDTIKRVIRAVYCFTKYMEYYYKLDSKLSYLYQDIDDVDNCDLMRLYKEEWDIKTIRDCFKLFAYVQSYALLRLGLIAASNVDDGKHLLKMKVNDMTMKIKVQSSRIPSFLDVTQNMQRLQENIKSEITKAVPKELRMISSDALKMSIQALSYGLQAHELQVAIDECTNNNMTEKKSIDNLLNQLEKIDDQIAFCNDEQHRLATAIKKYLKKDSEKISDETSLEEAVTTPVSSAVIKTIKEYDVQPQKDDFFYVDSSTSVDEAKHEPAKIEQDINEEDDVRVQFTKKCFKPVLIQLKEKIVPIGEDMKEREKKVLREKGIEVVEDEVNANKDDNNSGSDDERDRKIARSRSKFNESRDLLLSKKPFNIFGNQPSKPIPIKSGLHEEILE